MHQPCPMRQMIFHRKQTLISLRYLPCQQELRAACAASFKCDLHINVKVCRQMSRFLRSLSKKEKKKVAESSSGIKTRPSVKDVVVRMGLHWQGVYCDSRTLLLSLQLLRFCDGDRWLASFNFRGKGYCRKVEVLEGLIVHFSYGYLLCQFSFCPQDSFKNKVLRGISSLWTSGSNKSECWFSDFTV